MNDYPAFRENVLAVIDPRSDDEELDALITGMDAEMRGDVLAAVASFFGEYLSEMAHSQQTDIAGLIQRIREGMDKAWARER